MTHEDKPDETPRRPQVFDADDPTIEVSEEPNQTHRENQDDSDGPDAQQDSDGAPEPATKPKPTHPGRQWGWVSTLVSTAITLFFLALGLWYARFVSVALAREDWIGYVANGLAIIIGITALALIGRELMGLMRLSRLTNLRTDAERALAKKDARTEAAVARRLRNLLRTRRELKWHIARYREEERHKREPGEVLGLADRVLLEKPDSDARRIIYESARRVGVVTAVVPIAFIVMLFVLFENLRMVRRLSGAYGGSPGFFGGIRLFWWIIAHIAATGAIVLTDDLWGQFLGQDIARRLSTKVGEGAFNGALTARLGVAAVEVCRPLPYIEAKPLRVRAILRHLFPELDAGNLVRRAVGAKPAPRKDDDERA